MIEILHRYTKAVLYKSDLLSIKEALEAAARTSASLRAGSRTTNSGESGRGVRMSETIARKNDGV